MWERLEKLELLLCEQQGVISQLIDFYTAVESGEVIGGGCSIEAGDSGSCMELVPAHALPIVTDSALAISSTTEALISELKMKMGVDDLNLPDEAFYRSLNNAYRNDLVSTMHPPVAAMGASQLGMIWEEPEEDSNGNGRREEKLIAEELYGSVEFKEYRGTSPCVSNPDIHELTELSTMDQAAIEKLKELDILTTKLQADSRNLKELQDRLLCESPQRKYLIDACDNDPSTQGPNELDEQISRMYEESGIDNWSFRDDEEDDLMIKEPFETDANDDVRRSLSYSTTNLVPAPTSPRKRNEDNMYSPNRLDSSSPLSLRESHKSLPSSPKFKESGHTSPYKSVSLDQSEPEYAEITKGIYQDAAVAVSSSSIRTRQDGYIAPVEDIGLDLVEPEPSISGSPPPPAPQDCAYLLPGGGLNEEPTIHLYVAGEGLTVNNMDQPVGLLPRTPHSPKSPRTSPKHINKCAKLASAKSDSGLSSMSGWSSLEKSPGSPKATKTPSQHAESGSQLLHSRTPMHGRVYPAISVHPSTEIKEPGPSLEINVFSDNGNEYNGVLPGGHLASSFTPVRTPTILHEGIPEGFVPPPAPEMPTTPKQRRHKSFEYEPHHSEYSQDFPFQNERPPAIYSVAGSNRQQYFTSVYASKASGVPANIPSYPDIIGHYIQDQYRDVPTDRGMSTFDMKKAYPVGYTTVVPNTTKRSLQRVYSAGSVPSNQHPPGESIAHLEGYKTAMYRTMFPTGNITDALTYYPTGNVYSHMHPNVGQVMGPRVAYQEQWGCEPADLDLSRESSASTIRSAASTVQEMSFDGRYVDPRTPPKKPLRSDLSGSLQAQQHYQTGWIPPGEENTRIVMEQRPNVVPDQRLKQKEFYDPSQVIVSQSGYISFSADLKESVPEEKSKKPKKHAALKHAMSQVSHWLPDLHLPKRHRSYSLPSGVRREDLVKSKELGSRENGGQSTATNSRKKKKNIVSTMSGMLQKAKRKSPFHSMSDPEHSDTEWSGGRHSGVSDSEESAYSDPREQRPVPKMIRQNSAPPRPPQPLQIPPKLLQQSHSVTQPYQEPRVPPERPSQEDFQKQYPPPPSQQPAPLFAMMGSKVEKNEVEEEEEVPDYSFKPPSDEPLPTTFDDNIDPMSIFQTVGEAKKPPPAPTIEDEPKTQEPVAPAPLVPASREFAVSRALGKYRRRQSSTASEEDYQKIDDMYQVITQDEEEEEMRRNEIFERISSEERETCAIPTSVSQPENLPVTECNTATNHVNSRHGRFGPPRQQQSLEIPWGGRGSGDTDDDNRSTHSWRSTSRVSSRRQSTEDSIDSEDEWYCYELRKLEEMEKGGPVFAELPYDNEREILHAQEVAKMKMSNVLMELSCKIRPTIDIEEEKMLASIEQKPQPEPERKESVSSAKLLDDSDGSGATSGPDSPGHQQSADEAEELEREDDRRDSFRDSVRGSISDRQSREGSISVEPGEYYYEGTPVDPEIPIIRGPDDVPGTPSLPRFRFDTSAQSFSPPPPSEKDDSKEPTPPGVPKGAAAGKWKLLKALKERKAEEKSQEAEKKEAEKTASTVSNFDCSCLHCMHYLRSIPTPRPCWTRRDSPDF